MDVPTNILPFWSEFQASAGLDTSDRFYEAFHFDDNEPNANMLAELVLLGIKRATAGLLWSYEVTNWHREPLCVIETTDEIVVPFNEVSEEFRVVYAPAD